MLIRIRGGTPINSNHRFLREEAVSGKGGDKVHREIGNRTVSGMFNLSHVLEFVIDSLDNRPLPDQNLVCNAHERPFHVVPDFREQLNAINEQFLEEPLADVPLVPEELPGNVLQKGRVLEGFPVVHVAGGQHETEQLAFLVAYQVELEAVEPPHRALPPLRQPPKHPVQVDPLVAADSQCRAVHEAYPGAASHQVLLQEQDQRHHYLLLQFREPVVGYRIREHMAHMRQDIPRVEMFQTLIAAEMKQYHNRDDFRV